MFRQLLLAAATQGLMVLAVVAQDTGALPSSTLSASAILERVSAVYASCTTYRDAGVVEHFFSDPRPGADDTGRRVTREIMPFMTVFVRPGRFRFECKGSANGPRSPVLVGQAGSDVRFWQDRTGELMTFGSLDAALRMASTDSCDVSQDVPKLLVSLQVSVASLTKDLAEAERLGDADLEGVPCFRVHGKCLDSVQRPTECTLWIDGQSFLVRRIEKVRDALGPRETTTATYEPEVDSEISPGELILDPPKDSKTKVRELEAAKARAKRPPKLSEALELSMKGEHDEALIELDRLWTSDVLPGWEDQPLSPEEEQLLETIGREAAQHPPTLKHFAEIFDALDTEIRGGSASMHDWARWAALGRALKLDDRIVQLYVERRSPKGVIRPFVDWNPFVLDTLVDILVDKKQYADAGRLSADPAKQVQGQYQSLQMTMTGLTAEVRASSVVKDMRSSLRVEAGRLHALTLAAGRAAEAADVAHAMLLHDDTIEARRELISACLKFGVPCDSLAEWIADIRDRGGKADDLEAKIAAAEASRSGPDGH